jgi:hypothetical protein
LAAFTFAMKFVLDCEVDFNCCFFMDVEGRSWLGNVCFMFLLVVLSMQDAFICNF